MAGAFALVTLGGLGVAGSAMAQSCENFVGGVCLDQKQAPKTTPKKPRKQTAPRKTTAPKPAPAPAKTAADCVSVELKNVGKPSGAASIQEDARGTLLVLRNSCAQTVVSYIRLRNCINPAPYFDPSPSIRKRKATIAPKARKSLLIVRGKGFDTRAELMKLNFVFQGQKGGYPPGC